MCQGVCLDLCVCVCVALFITRPSSTPLYTSPDYLGTPEFVCVPLFVCVCVCLCVCMCLFWLLFSTDDWWPATTLEEFSGVSNYVRLAASKCRAGPSTVSRHPLRRGERVPSGTETRQLEDVCDSCTQTTGSHSQCRLHLCYTNTHRPGDDVTTSLMWENPPCSIFSQMLWLLWQSCTHFSAQFLFSKLNFYFENKMAKMLMSFLFGQKCGHREMVSPTSSSSWTYV